MSIRFHQSVRPPPRFGDEAGAALALAADGDLPGLASVSRRMLRAGRRAEIKRLTDAAATLPLSVASLLTNTLRDTAQTIIAFRGREPWRVTLFSIPCVGLVVQTLPRLEGEAAARMFRPRGLVKGRSSVVLVDRWVRPADLAALDYVSLRGVADRLGDLLDRVPEGKDVAFPAIVLPSAHFRFPSPVPDDADRTLSAWVGHADPDSVLCLRHVVGMAISPLHDLLADNEHWETSGEDVRSGVPTISSAGVGGGDDGGSGDFLASPPPEPEIERWCDGLRPYIGDFGTAGALPLLDAVDLGLRDLLVANLTLARARSGDGDVRARLVSDQRRLRIVFSSAQGEERVSIPRMRHLDLASVEGLLRRLDVTVEDAAENGGAEAPPLVAECGGGGR